MLLPKVIEILDLNLKEAGKKMPQDTFTALGISVEAVKAIQDYREGLTVDFLLPLPGETEE